MDLLSRVCVCVYFKYEMVNKNERGDLRISDMAKGGKSTQFYDCYDHSVNQFVNKRADDR